MHLSNGFRETPTVFVVDPDPSTGQLTRQILDGSGISCVVHRTGREFLSADRDCQPGCIVLELRLPDMSGLQLQHRLSALEAGLPLVFAIANPEVSIAVELMRGGAVHVLEKPVRPAELLQAIQEALQLNRERRTRQDEKMRVKGLTATLSQRELEVLELIAHGKSPKEIAAALELSVRAVELRRKSLICKLRVGSSLELMRFSVIARTEFGRQRGFAAAGN
jgi:FixJ family two-component response regulator